jgi:hypothetical protein
VHPLEGSCFHISSCDVSLLECHVSGGSSRSDDPARSTPSASNLLYIKVDGVDRGSHCPTTSRDLNHQEGPSWTSRVIKPRESVKLASLRAPFDSTLPPGRWSRLRVARRTNHLARCVLNPTSTRPQTRPRGPAERLSRAPSGLRRAAGKCSAVRNLRVPSAASLTQPDSFSQPRRMFSLHDGKLS